MRIPFLFAVILFCSCMTEEPPVFMEFRSTVQYDVQTDVDQDLLSLDIHHDNQEGALKPVVIWVHGGGWCIGDKGNNINDKLDLFRSLDYIFVSVNYRLSPFPYEVDNPNRVMFPDHPTDLANAIKWVHDNIEEYGGDPDKLALLGHSAGAHMVSLVGTNKTFLEDVGLSLSDLKGVASIDTEGYDVVKKIEEGSVIYENAFGSKNERNIEASPILNIKSIANPPQFFIAKRGTDEREQASEDFKDELTASGYQVTVVQGSIYDHSGINQAIGKEGEVIITEPLVKFLKACFL